MPPVRRQGSLGQVRALPSRKHDTGAPTRVRGRRGMERPGATASWWLRHRQVAAPPTEVPGSCPGLAPRGSHRHKSLHPRRRESPGGQRGCTSSPATWVRCRQERGWRPMKASRATPAGGQVGCAGQEARAHSAGRILWATGNHLGHPGWIRREPLATRCLGTQMFGARDGCERGQACCGHDR